MRGRIRGALLTSISVVALTATAQGAEQSPIKTIEEVTVTAQKRDEKLKEVPMSVSALTSATLDRLEARGFADYLALVPGVSFVSTGPGNSRITLRGQNTGSVASTTSIYVDETPFGSSTGLVNGAILSADFDTWDLQRVEILRGPQGTLYGANSEGGLIKYVMNAPDPSGFYGTLQTGIESVVGHETALSAHGTVNVPLTDTIAFRASGYHEFLPGYVSDLNLGHKDSNDGTKDGARAALLFQPFNNLSIKLSVFGQDIHNNDGSGVDSPPQPGMAPPPLVPFNALAHRRAIPEPSTYQYREYNATVNYTFDWVQITSATSYGLLKANTLGDNTGSLGPALSAAFKTSIGVDLTNLQDLNKFSQELRFASTGAGPLDWQFGGFFTHENGRLDQFLRAFSLASQGPSGLPDLEHAQLLSHYTEWSGFGTLTYHFNQEFDIQAGGRYASNSQNVFEGITGLAALIGPPTIINQTSTDNTGTYSVAPRWHVNDQTLVYARVASGYRPGGPNVLPGSAPSTVPHTYQPDSTTNYELGVKTELAGGKVSLDAAAFHIDWQDIQLFTVVRGTFNGVPYAYGINANGGSAVSQGFEGSLEWIPLDGLKLDFSGAFTDATLTKDAPAAGGFKNNRLPYVPQWSGALNAEYDWQAFGGYTAFFGGTLTHTGSEKSGFSSGKTQATLPNYDLLGLRAGIEDARWTFEIYGQNLTDKRAIVNYGAGIAAPYSTLTFVQPRSVGVTLTARF